MKKLDIFHMKTAWLLAMESSCISKRIGCVIVKGRSIVTSGYNGTRSGMINCCDHAKNSGWTVNVDGIDYLSSKHRSKHSQWSGIHEYHAEQNAIDNATRLGISLDGCDLFTTLSPCTECCKRITNIGINRVVYSELYDLRNREWIDYLEEHGVKVERLSIADIQEYDLENGISNYNGINNLSNFKWDLVYDEE